MKQYEEDIRHKNRQSTSKNKSRSPNRINSKSQNSHNLRAAYW